MIELGQSTIRISDTGRFRGAAIASVFLAASVLTLSTAAATARACLPGQCGQAPVGREVQTEAKLLDSKNWVGDFPLGGTPFDKRLPEANWTTEASPLYAELGLQGRHNLG